MEQNKTILWFDEVGKEDLPSVGGKGASLGEMVKAGIAVPPGFIVTTEAYFYFLQEANLIEPIENLVKDLNHSDTASLNDASDKVKALIRDAPMPAEVASQIREAYSRLGDGLVAVRSSATAEDLPEASFAGQQSTFLNVAGEEEVVAAVHECWASLFEPRAIFYRCEQGFDHLGVGIAVPVQRMVQSETSGVLFTAEPVSGDTARITIEAVFGLGEAIVSGAITPDLYIVDKDTLSIVEWKTARQEWQLVRNPDFSGNSDETNIRQDIPLARQSVPKLKGEEIQTLAEMGRSIEKLYSFPQDIEWARENGRFYILQSRPITTLGEAHQELKRISAKLLIQGSGASPGIDSGPVKIVHNPSELDKVEKGDVLVAEMTTPDYVPAMKRAAAIVTDKGGRTCHAAIVSRELGVPCVVGTYDPAIGIRATRILTEGLEITVDGSQGQVFEGRLDMKRKEVAVLKRRIRTATRVYVNLADPDLADVIAQREVDGVGLLRAEFIIAHIGRHPLHMLEQNQGHRWTDMLAQGMERFCAAFHPRPVVYRTSDFKTNEYRNLLGGEKYEEEEENPMIGYRGCSRYVRDREAFQLEIEAIKKVRQRYDNLYVMLPFVRTPDELARVEEVLESEGLSRDVGLKLWMMVEVPSNVILLDQFIDVGIDGISIGSNDLTQLILGIDRDNAKLDHLFDERDPAVLWGLERAVTIAVKRGTTSSICGQAPSFYPNLTEKLVQWGITSVSVSPDMIDRTREIIARVEKKLGTLPPQEG